MKTLHAALWILVLSLAAAIPAAAMEMDWAYHEADGQSLRTTEKVPTRDQPFLANGTTEIPPDEAVTIYVMTANQFAGDADEQVFLRWWNGVREFWIRGEWVANILLDISGENAGVFRGKPDFGSVMVDLWKIVVPPEYTRPGDNYYVIQLKAWSPEGSFEGYLLRDSGVEGARVNNLGQAWTDNPDFAGHDWLVKIAD